MEIEQQIADVQAQKKNQKLPNEILWQVYDLIDDELDSLAFYTALVGIRNPFDAEDQWLLHEHSKRWTYAGEPIEGVYTPHLPYSHNFEETVRRISGLIMNYDTFSVAQSCWHYQELYRQVRVLFDNEIRSASRSVLLFEGGHRQLPPIWKVEFKRRLATSATYLIALKTLLEASRDTNLELFLFSQEDYIEREDSETYLRLLGEHPFGNDHIWWSDEEQIRNHDHE